MFEVSRSFGLENRESDYYGIVEFLLGGMQAMYHGPAWLTGRQSQDDEILGR